MLTYWPFGRRKAHHGIMMGLDQSGRTTMLFRMKFGKVVTTIPTIGINVEEISYKGWTLTLWDVGGCDKIRPLLHHYFAPDRFAIYFHDCSDTDRLDESLEELQVAARMLIEKGSKHLWVLLNKQDMIPQPERQERIQDLRSRFLSALEPYRDKLVIELMDYPGLSGITGQGVDLIVPRLHQVLLSNDRNSPATAIVEAPTGKAPSQEELIERIDRAERESRPPGEFWDSFLRGDLPAWDHLSHLRTGYHVMLYGFTSGSSVLDCAETFIQHLERLRETNPDRFRNTTHRTMTIFWLLQVQRAALKYQSENRRRGYPLLEDFSNVLRSSPELVDPGLWKKHYTRELMFTPDARNTWRLPDIEPLPAFVVATDQEVQPQVSHHNQRLVLQFALTLVQTALRSTASRGAIIKRSLGDFEQFIMRLRARGEPISPYSETQTYFWIQLFHAAAASFGKAQSLRSTFSNSIGVLDLEAFMRLFGIKDGEWEEYYSEDIWNSIGSRSSFTPPNLKPLPNVIITPSNEQISAAQEHLLAIAAEKHQLSGIPDTADLLVMAAAGIEEAALLKVTLKPTTVSSHTELLVLLHRAIVKSEKEKAGRISPLPAENQALAVAIETAVKIASAAVEGVTHAMFWVQAFLRTREAGAPIFDFTQFITTYNQLAFEQLPLAFYSTELWNSAEAKQQFLLPDKRSLSEILA